jgi:hypothetical protein
VSIKGGKFDEAKAWIYDPDETNFKEVLFQYKNIIKGTATLS